MMTRTSLAWTLITFLSLGVMGAAHALLSAHAIDTGMAGSLLGRPSLDSLGHASNAVSLLALRVALVLVAPGIACATIASLLVNKRR